MLPLMKKLWTLTTSAFADAALAEDLSRDPAYRRWLRAETESALRMFQLAQPLTTRREIAVRQAIGYRRLLLGGEEA